MRWIEVKTGWLIETSSKTNKKMSICIIRPGWSLCIPYTQIKQKQLYTAISIAKTWFFFLKKKFQVNKKL